MVGIAIHGFGRIGRSALKAALAHELFVPASVSDIRDAKTYAALFKADSNYGLWPEAVEATPDTIRDLPVVQVLHGTLASIPAWYDNEMGYSTRLAEAAEFLARND